MRRRRRWWWAVVVATVCTLGATSACGKDDADGGARMVIDGTKELGSDCKSSRECRPGLTCLHGTCAPKNAGRTAEELERAYEMGQERTDRALDRYDPSRQ